MADAGRDRLTSMFAAAAAEGRSAFLPYLMAGLPDAATSADLFVAAAEAGADGFEVGIPYSDPLMDGPVIMEAGERALAAGATVAGCLDILRRVTERTALPAVVMSYVNPILRRGVDAFFADVAAAGGAGIIIADLPVDESQPFLEAAARNALGMVLFAAPTTDDGRLGAIAAAEPAFVYAVADMGVTGARDDASRSLAGLIARVRAVTDRPVVAGVGISTPEQARAAATVADGVIVGSAIVRAVLDAEDPEQARRRVGSAVATFAAALRS